MADRYRLASPLIDLMRSITQREFEARLAWINEDLGSPSRSDWYAMQIAAEIRKTRAKSPNRVSLSDMKLKPKEDSTPPVTRKEAADRSRAYWLGSLGIKGPEDGD